MTGDEDSPTQYRVEIHFAKMSNSVSKRGTVAGVTIFHSIPYQETVPKK